MSELAENMQELDAQSAALYEKLGRLEEVYVFEFYILDFDPNTNPKTASHLLTPTQELRNETVEFEEKKQLELNELIQMQNKFKGDFQKSQNLLQNSTKDMKDLMEVFT